MQFSVEVGSFLQALKAAKGALVKSKSIPILNCTLLEVQNGKCKLSAFYPATCIFQAEIVVGVNEVGSIAIEPGWIINAIKELPKNEIISLKAIQDDQGLFLELKASNLVQKFSAFDSERFPTMPTIEGQLIAGFDKQDLQNAIPKVFYGAQADEGYGSRILFAFAKGECNLVYTNGHSLAKLYLNCASDSISQVQIPALNLEHFLGIKKSDFAEYALIESNANYVLQGGDSRLIISRIEERYPNWQFVLNSAKNGNVASVDLPKLQSIVKQIPIIKSDKLQSINLQFTGSFLRISGNGLSAEMPCQSTAKFECNLGLILLQVMLKGCVQKEKNLTANWFFTGKTSAIRWDFANGLQYLIMPLTR